MNKKIVEGYLPRAWDALNSPKCKIAQGGRISKTFRGQISSFGAAVTMGSFKAAVAFFSEDGGAGVPRSELIRAVHYVINGSWEPAKDICGKVVGMEGAALSAAKEEYLNASVALKLAMNAFELTDESEGK